MTYKLNAGFTLIELLIVIAIIGVLAAAMLIAINPLEQIARSRDAGRISAIAQLARAMQAYATFQGGIYPAADPNWEQTLVNNGDVKSIVPQTGNLPCWGDSTGNSVNNYCYANQLTNPALKSVYIWTKLESQAQISKCSPNTGEVYYGWDSASGNTCLRCAVYPRPYALPCNGVQ